MQSLSTMVEENKKITSLNEVRDYHLKSIKMTRMYNMIVKTPQSKEVVKTIF